MVQLKSEVFHGVQHFAPFYDAVFLLVFYLKVVNFFVVIVVVVSPR